VDRERRFTYVMPKTARLSGSKGPPLREEPDGEITDCVNIRRHISERKRTEERLEEARQAERAGWRGIFTTRPCRSSPEPWPTSSSCGHDTRRRIFAWSKLSTALKRTEQRVRSAVYDLGLEGDRNKVFTELLENLIEIHSEMAHEIEISLETEGADFSEALGRTGTELLRIIGEAMTNARQFSTRRSTMSVGLDRWASRGHSPGGGEAQLREGCQPSCGIDQGRGNTIVGRGEWTRRWYRSGVWDSCVG